MWHRHLGGLIALLMLMKFCGFLPPNGVSYIGSDTSGYKEGFRTPVSSSALFCVVILLYQWYKEAFRVKKDGVLCECDPVRLLSTALCRSGTQLRSCRTIFSFIALSPKQAAPQLVLYRGTGAAFCVSPTGPSGRCDKVENQAKQMGENSKNCVEGSSPNRSRAQQFASVPQWDKPPYCHHLIVNWNRLGMS